MTQTRCHWLGDPRWFGGSLRLLGAVLLLAGCQGPQTTGPNGMTGELVNAAGEPVPRVSIESVEARDLTDSNGRFAVTWKRHSQWIHFLWQTLWFKRSYTADDANTDVRLVLPQVAERPYVCVLPTPCELTFEWTLAPAFTARAIAPCEPNHPARLTAAPLGQPKATCRESRGTQPIDVDVRIIDERLRISPLLSAIQIEVRSENGGLQNDCIAGLNDDIGTANGTGWEAEGWGHSTAWARCAGLPATPQWVDMNTTTQVVLEWSPVGPTLDLEEWSPAVDRLILHAPAEGWQLTLAERDTGTFALPPLRPGRYWIQSPVLPPGTAPPSFGAPTGHLQLERPSTTTVVGGLVLDVDLLSGPISVDVISSPAGKMPSTFEAKSR